MLTYSDHHIFTIDDIKEINKKFDAIKSSNKYILTTEKDAVRFLKFSDQLNMMPLYIIPIKHHFLFEEGKKFDKAVIDFIKNFKPTQVDAS